MDGETCSAFAEGPHTGALGSAPNICPKQFLAGRSYVDFRKGDLISGSTEHENPAIRARTCLLSAEPIAQFDQEEVVRRFAQELIHIATKSEVGNQRDVAAQVLPNNIDCRSG